MYSILDLLILLKTIFKDHEQIKIAGGYSVAIRVAASNVIAVNAVGKADFKGTNNVL